MLASHKSMTEFDMLQMNNMRAVGIGTPQIYGSLARQCGGYDHLQYRYKDVYNQIAKQHKLKNMHAKFALQYLSDLRVSELVLFYCYIVDEDRKLQYLFWCDGIMQIQPIW